ncbi:hypothetical protein [Halosimplex pelagicum]|uniref:Uncharacterized protein n=1 Tax=Halosimplex pelagicum TaxID=869886 RepID=A0A7D5P938_9EURY|nr:hypothetical protein [Halosimplex pelagicum]QLH82321.1 hypothetical protein HZS54_12165 [Halosimplex pelagicum]
MDGDTLPLDEDEEHYGYGILNVHRNQFVSPLGGADNGDESDVFSDEENLLEFYEELAEEQDSVSHLRIVQVRLDNDLDQTAAESVSDDE